MELSSEHKVWAAVVMRKFQDAIWPFTMTGAIEEEMKKLQKKNNFYCSTKRYNETRALSFFESSNFNEVAGLLGYDTEFVSRTFNKIQEYLTAKKQLRREGHLS